MINPKSKDAAVIDEPFLEGRVRLFKLLGIFGYSIGIILLCLGLLDLIP